MALLETENDSSDAGRLSSHSCVSPKPAQKAPPSRREAEAAVATLIRWAGDDPARPGLAETPERVVRAYEEWFAGYGQDPARLLTQTFDETESYGGPVELRGIPVHAFCEHHLAPIRGVAHVAYLPGKRVVGISKLARVVEAFARRLQIQERLTAEIAHSIESALCPAGVAVVIDAEHGCMTSRGVRSHSTRMVTKELLGRYRTNTSLRSDFLGSLQG